MPSDLVRWICIATLVAGALGASRAPAIDIEYIYDANGRLEEIRRSDGWIIRLGYDEAGNLTSRDVEPGASADEVNVSVGGNAFDTVRRGDHGALPGWHQIATQPEDTASGTNEIRFPRTPADLTWGIAPPVVRR